MHDVMTIGAASRDVFLISSAFEIIRSKQFPTGMGECVSFGSKIEVEKIVHSTGGGATNAATTFARLGFDAAVISRIGEDDAADDVIDALKAEGISTTFVRRVKAGQTAYSTLLTVPDGERSVLVARGVSQTFSTNDIPWAKLNTRWLYVTSLAGNTRVMTRLAKFATEKSIHLAWNPGGRELKLGYSALLPMLKHVRVLILNLEEAQTLLGEKTRDVKRLIAGLALPGQTVVLTDGGVGAYACEGTTLRFIRARPMKVVSRTGAGDAFGSGFVSALIQGRGIDDGLRVGLINAEGVIAHYGAKAGIMRQWPKGTTLKSIKVRTL